MDSNAYVANDKIISIDPVVEYLEQVEKIFAEYERIDNEEKARNETLPFEQRTRTHETLSKYTKYEITRVDGGHVEYRSIGEVKNALLVQPYSIRNIYFHVSLWYGGAKHATSDITASPNRFKVEYTIDNGEPAFYDATMAFIRKIDDMPPKLDRIIRQKSFIIMKTGFAMGMIPAIILGIASLFVPPLFELYKQFFYVMPLLVLAVGFVLGAFLGGMKLNSPYSKLIPTKYGGFDKRTLTSYHVDDMEKFTEEVDVLIGPKAEFAKARKTIENTEKFFNKFILPELGAVAALTLITFIVVMIGGR